MRKPIALAVPVVNRFDMFTELMDTVDTPVYPIVVDNWRENRGVSGAWNLAMQRANELGFDHVLIANDDVKFAPGAITLVMDTLRATGAALVSPNQNGSRGGKGVNPGADFFCFAVDIKQTVTHAGWFDENFYPAYFEDNDMHLRMLRSGLTTLCNHDAVVYHEGSMSQKLNPDDPPTPPAAFETNRTYYKQKWGGGPTEETFGVPFNHPRLTIRDWRGSIKYDGSEEAEEILATVRTVPDAVPMFYEAI